MVSIEGLTDSTAIINLDQNSTMEGLALRGPTERENQLVKGRFDNSVVYQEWVIRNQFALYPENHPAHRYSQDLLARLRKADDPKEYRVTVYKGRPNAFCLPNGSIYIADELIQMADADEEVLFVLGHEKQHVDQEHASKSAKASEAQSAKSILHQALSHFGQARIHEWEADLRSFNDLESLGINPMGGVDFLEKFRNADKRQWKMIDPVHGKDTDRVLNLRMMTHMQDITTVQNPFNPIPENVSRSLRTESNFVSWYDSFVENLDNRKVNVLDRLLKDANGPTAILILGELIHKHETQLTFNSDSAKRWADFQRRFITSLTQKVWSYISETFDPNQSAKLSDQQKTFLLYTVLELTGGSHATNPDNQDFFFHPTLENFKLPNGQPMAWTKRRISFQEKIYADEDVDELLDLLNPEIVTKLGVKFNFPPTAFIENVTKRVLTREIYSDDEGNIDIDSFVDFANRFADTMANLYEAHGTIEVSSKDIYKAIIEMAGTHLPKDIFVVLEKAATKKGQERGKNLNGLEITEDVSETKLLKIFKDLIGEVEPYASEYVGRVEQREQLQKIGTKYNPLINKILEDSGIDTRESLLTFLASFRNKFMDDPEAWNDYESRDIIHNSISSLVYNFICEKYLPNGLSESAEGMLFKMKTALLLSSDKTLWKESALDNLADEFQDFMDTSRFSISEYERFYKLATSEALDKEMGIPTHIIELLEYPLDDIWLNSLRKGIYIYLDRAASSSISREEFNQLVEHLTIQFPFNHFGEDIEYIGEEAAKEQKPLKNKLLEKIFNTYQFDLTDPQDLKALYFLSTYLEDTSFAIPLQEMVWQKLAEHLPFSEGVVFLQQEVKSRRLLSLKAAQNYIEQSARTHDEIKQARNILVGFLTSETDSSDFGRLLVAEQFIDTFFRRSKPEFLFACIGNGANDNNLKTYLYDRWTQSYNFVPQTTEGYINLNDVLQKLYSLDAQKKYVLIRDLLTGENGVLTHRNSRYREQLVDFFIDNYVEASDDFEKGMQSVVRDVMKEMMKTAGYDLLYFAFAPLLQNRILLPPPNRIFWRTVIENEVPPRAFEVEEQDWTRTGIDEVQPDRPTSESADRIFSLINGAEQIDFIKVSNEARHNYEAIVEDLISTVEKKPEKLKLTVTEFIAEVAQTLGAPGVRFLQLIGQYVELPPYLEEAFRGIYDKVEGQSKITADQTLLREWPEAENRLDGLITRVGGGSLMSVFQATDDEAKQRAVKILNPNSGFHADMTYQLLTEVFTNLAQRNPQFNPALAVLDDIREWIRGDIDFTGFIEMDRRFKEKHDGFSKGGRYKIKVPASYDPENKFFSQEEYIEGVNLTNIDQLTQQGHNLKEVISELTANFYEQIRTGVVHSDIHPGNIRITPNNEIALLDRNFYIQLSLQDRFFLAGLTQRLGDTISATGYCLDYLRSQGQEIDQETRARIIEQVDTLADTPNLTNRLLGLTVLLRREGLRFPLKITLLVKDLFYLDRMAKRVGYSGISEILQ